MGARLGALQHFQINELIESNYFLIASFKWGVFCAVSGGETRLNCILAPGMFISFFNE